MGPFVLLRKFILSVIFVLMGLPAFFFLGSRVRYGTQNLFFIKKILSLVPLQDAGSQKHATRGLSCATYYPGTKCANAYFFFRLVPNTVALFAASAGNSCRRRGPAPSVTSYLSYALRTIYFLALLGCYSFCLGMLSWTQICFRLKKWLRSWQC